jgi:hypothetical protein
VPPLFAARSIFADDQIFAFDKAIKDRSIGAAGR